MKGEMTIKEARHLKSKLEDNIADLINEFRDDTDIDPIGLELSWEVMKDGLRYWVRVKTSPYEI